MNIYLCVRIPKSGSSSLGEIVASAFAGSRTFVLPNTLDLDGRISMLQRMRARRSRLQTLLRHYPALTLDQAFASIRANAKDGDLIHGGHIDFPSARRELGAAVKIVTMLRDPYRRAISEYNYSR